jgi:hypothetical protein
VNIRRRVALPGTRWDHRLSRNPVFIVAGGRNLISCPKYTLALLISMMKHALSGMGICILVAVLIACPVQAFTAKNLDITIQDNTDAIITFDYDLSWYENIAVFSRIADPANELAKALTSQFGKKVEVTYVSGNHAQFLVEKFAVLKKNDGVVSLNTPALSFKNAEKVLNNYWFARFISPDFSPEITRVSFPDGYREEFSNQDQIPSVRHVIKTPS